MQAGVLVTGGAGYIGSHVVRHLGARGERVVVLDDLSTGFADAVTCGELVIGDVGDVDLVARILASNRVDTVMHFAARTIVPESIAEPLRYYADNVGATRRLLACCRGAGVEGVVFSSSAAVYGEFAGGRASEDTPTRPVNPYGTTKLVCEWMLRDLAAVGMLRYVALRYFNVAGSDPQGRVGQRTPNATLLIKVAAEVALGKRAQLEVFGTDYPTPDGTGVRDYIHVEDLADAHLKALDHLRAGGENLVLNCGYGHGASVREVVAAVEAVTGQQLPVIERGRRPGDAPMLIAAAERIQAELGWTPRYDDLKFIVRSAIDWERRLPY